MVAVVQHYTFGLESDYVYESYPLRGAGEWFTFRMLYGRG